MNIYREIDKNYLIIDYDDRTFIYMKTYGGVLPTYIKHIDNIYNIQTSDGAKTKENKDIVVAINIYHSIKTYEEFYKIVVEPNDAWYFKEDMLKAIKYYMKYRFLT